MPKVIKLYLLQRFFAHLILFWSVDKIFFTQRGISPFQLSILLGLWALYSLIFEVPSGAIADRWSRKWILVISSLFHSLAYTVWLFATNFWEFLLGYIFRGTGGFLESGTKEALLYDHLKALNKENEYEKYVGRLWVVTTIAFLSTSLISGTLADRYSFALILVLSVLSNIIAGIVAISIPEAPRTTSTEETSYLKFLGLAFKKVVRNPLILQIIVYAATVVCVYETFDEYDQLYVSSIGLPLGIFGVWWAIRMGSEALAGVVAHRFKKWNVDTTLNYIALATAVILIVAGLTSTLLILPVLGLMFFLFSIAKILNEGRLQRYIESHERATIISVNSLFVESMGILIGLAFGYVSSITNPRSGILVFAGVIILYLLFELLGSKRSKLALLTITWCGRGRLSTKTLHNSPRPRRVM